MEPIIKLENVSKTFVFSENESLSIREKVKNIFSQKDSKRIIRSLRDISFEVYPGEFFGIIGHNGSGKSTLLKIILGAYKPDKGGMVKTQGRLIRLALGLGFDFNLSARDNIYVNGSILGMNFREIGRIFEDIISFAELKSYEDTPLKYYSSGMVSRLAFSIAIRADSDALLIDEFFGGVGDVNFQKKSEEAFKQFISDNKTIVIVSHDLELMKEKCHRLLLLHKGESIIVDKPELVIDQYHSLMNKN